MEEIKMETLHPSMLDLLLESHIGLERQGPGSTEAVEQALGFLKPLNQFSANCRFRMRNWRTDYSFSTVPVWYNHWSGYVP